MIMMLSSPETSQNDHQVCETALRIKTWLMACCNKSCQVREDHCGKRTGSDENNIKMCFKFGKEFSMRFISKIIRTWLEFLWRFDNKLKMLFGFENYSRKNTSTNRRKKRTYVNCIKTASTLAMPATSFGIIVGKVIFADGYSTLWFVTILRC